MSPVGSLAGTAIDWYDAHARDLPWRRPGTTAWGVLVSEVMSQQTPVARVAPAWLDWLARWPTPAALAERPQAEAIRAWGRLGYPRRALRLHECAATLVRHHDGAVPPDLPDLLELPGVGEYTARAVAAFAFGQRHPVVDTNVRRLVARACQGHPDGGPATTTADLVRVEQLLPNEPARAARASAAFMELGALVCTARTPACGDCPLRTNCRWHAGGTDADRTGTAGPPRPSRRPQAYAGTDRQVRGLILALARQSHGPVPRTAVDLVWPLPDQRGRALAGLLTDGLLVEVDPGHYGLPGDA
jgi:A/G-specific adenine glycosylase